MEAAHVNAAAWPILLQHDSIRAELRVAAKLMCCSKELAAAVAEHCTGRLAMDTFWRGEARGQQAERWMLKHGRLLRELDTWSFEGAFLQALVAAGPQHLQLQSLEAGGLESLSLLERLPAHRLTRLGLCEVKSLPGDWDRPQYAARLSAVITRLTALQDLELHMRWSSKEGWWPHETDLELPGLSALTSLTRMVCRGPCSTLQHLPEQLLQLEVTDKDGEFERDDQQTLDLRHLTALTSLNTEGEGQCTLLQGDVLPPNLMQLHVQECRSVQPLLGLKQLQDLDLSFRSRLDITAQQLAAFSGLTSLRLWFDGATQAQEPASAAAWPLLPLKCLRLHKCRLPVAVCQALGQVTGLTCLELECCELADLAALDGGAQGMPLLGQLTGLQSLKCRARGWQAGSDGCLTDASLSCVGQLQQLTELSLGSTSVTDAGLPHLVGLSNLRVLSLNGTDVSDAGLPVLAGMSHLQKLTLFFSKKRLSQDSDRWLKEQLPSTLVRVWPRPTARPASTAQ